MGAPDAVPERRVYLPTASEEARDNTPEMVAARTRAANERRREAMIGELAATPMASLAPMVQAMQPGRPPTHADLVMGRTAQMAEAMYNQRVNAPGVTPQQRQEAQQKLFSDLMGLSTRGAGPMALANALGHSE